tara:strand:+ start:3527 stop:4534 length:1008 start_codon:yes stop_codon:yes gene_type:complete
MERLLKSNSSKKVINEKISLPWIEKYRPKNTNEILLDKNLRSKIETILTSRNIGNMIITGEPGTGKTSTVLCIINKLYDEIEKEYNILELNASDDRGLNIINNTIIPFCKKKKYKEKLKIIVLDEADSLTLKAQNLLSSLITLYTKNTRFIFICNEYNKVIESIQSNCLIINYPSISKKNIKKKIKEISKKENINIDEDSINDLIFVSDNNIRQVINNMECIYYCYKKINSETIYKIIDKPKPFYIKKILKYCFEGKLEDSIDILNELYNKGYSPNDILQTFMKFILEDDFEFDKKTKMKLYEIISLSYIRVNDGIDSFLQLSGCLCKIFLFINN